MTKASTSTNTTFSRSHSDSPTLLMDSSFAIMDDDHDRHHSAVDEHAPLMDDCSSFTASRGDSSLLQTSLNMGNVIMGVGILALPSAFKLAGWIFPIGFLLLFGLASSSSAKILAACQRQYLRQTGTPLLSYGDIGEAAFGTRGRWFIQTIFIFELFAACVAMLILVTHSTLQVLHYASWDDLPSDWIKVLVWLFVTMLTWPKSLRLLSYSSFLGVLCLGVIVFSIVFDGLYVKESPGSLWKPAPTYLWPISWMRLPSVIGVCMVGYSGHACFPGMYASMRESKKYPKAVNAAFGAGLFLYLFVSAVGFLMFGADVRKLITDNLEDPEFPQIVGHITRALIIVNASSKYPLLLFPIVNEVELFLLRRFPSFAGHSADSQPLLSSTEARPSRWRRLFFATYWPNAVRRILFRTIISSLVLVIAMAVPDFQRVLSFLGALFAMTTSIIFPLLCYLAFFKPPLEKWPSDYHAVRTEDSTAPYWKRVVVTIAIFVFMFLALVGTIWAILPEALLIPL